MAYYNADEQVDEDQGTQQLSEWVNKLSVSYSEQVTILGFFNENEIGFDDLLAMNAIDEVKELEIGIFASSEAQLWKAIQSLKQDINNCSGSGDEYNDANGDNNGNHKNGSKDNGPYGSDIDMMNNGNNNNDDSIAGNDEGGACDESLAVGSNDATNELDNGNVNNAVINTIDEIETIKEGGMAGLNNMGNTCFMNSAIQCLLHTPGFTDVLANEINKMVSFNGNNNNINKYGNNRDNKNSKNKNKNKNKKVKSPKAAKIDKNEWLNQLQINDICDAWSKADGDWYAAQVIDIAYYNNNNGNNNNRRRKKKGNNGSQIRELRVHYRGYLSKYDETFDLTKNSGYDNIDPPNTHGVHCEHWRHDIQNNDEIDYYDNEGQQWIIATMKEYVHRRGFKIQYSDYYTDFEYVSRYDKKIAAFGTYTQSNNDNNNNSNSNCNSNGHNDDSSSWSVSNTVKYIFGFGNNNNNYNNNNYGYRHNKYGYNNRYSNYDGSFYEAWLAMVNRVHLNQDGSSFHPSAIFGKMANYNPILGDGGQHDAIEALTVILHGIKDSLPPSLVFNANNNNNNNNGVSGQYIFTMNESIYDKEYKWDCEMDRQICERLIETNEIDFGSDLISYYFQGIEMIEETCLNCGFLRKIYCTFNELSLPVSQESININVFYYSLLRSKYECVSLKLPIGSNISLIKFLVLCKMFNKPNQWNKMSKYGLITINNKYNNISNDFATILSNKYKINQACTLLLVPKISFAFASQYSNGNHNNANEVIYVQSNNLTNQLYFCILLLRQSYFSHKQFKSAFLSNESKYLNHVRNSININDNNNTNTNSTNFSFSTYYNGDINKNSNDNYYLSQSNNVIIGNFHIKSSKANERRNSNSSSKRNSHSHSHSHSQGRSRTNTMYTTDETVEDSKFDTNLNDSRNDNISKDISKEIGRITECIATYQSELEAINYLKQEIKRIEKCIKNNARPGWFERFMSEPKVKSNTINMTFQEKQISLKAHKYLLKEFETIQLRKQTVLNNFSKKLDVFLKVNNFGGNHNNNRFYGSKKLGSLNECLDAYSSIKYMPKRDLAPALECQCDNNNTVPFAKVETSIVIGPRLLILSLARGKGQSKQNHIVNFGENLMINEKSKNEIGYDLRSVCNHFGGGTKFGHYTANVKQLGTEIWHECDDSRCSRSRFSTNNAIMMIYQKY